MEKLHSVLAPYLIKAIDHFPYIVFVWMFVLTVLLVVALVRQQRVVKLGKVVTANFENIRAKIDEQTSQNKRQVLEGVAVLAKQLKELGTDQRKISAETAGLGNHLEDVNTKLRDQIQEIGNIVAGMHVGGGGADEAVIAEISAKLEDVYEEITWTHHYYDELKVLETAVSNLVGPEKMAKLIEKERTGASRAAKEEIFRKL